MNSYSPGITPKIDMGPINRSAWHLARVLDENEGVAWLDHWVLREMRDDHRSGCHPDLLADSMLALPQFIDFDADVLVQRLNNVEIELLVRRSAPPQTAAGNDRFQPPKEHKAWWSDDEVARIFQSLKDKLSAAFAMPVDQLRRISAPGTKLAQSKPKLSQARKN